MYTVLAITCHPDDMEIACAGTLLKCKERGDRVVICHLSSGNLVRHTIGQKSNLHSLRLLLSYVHARSRACMQMCARGRTQQSFYNLGSGRKELTLGHLTPLT